MADFGASKDFVGDPESDPTNGWGGGSMTMTMSMAGTPVYMAPEVLRQDRYGKPCDVWSFGGLLVHIATGQPPFFALLKRGGISPLNLMQAGLLSAPRGSSRLLSAPLSSSPPDVRDAGRHDGESNRESNLINFR